MNVSACIFVFMCVYGVYMFVCVCACLWCECVCVCVCLCAYVYMEVGSGGIISRVNRIKGFLEPEP